MLPTTYNLPTIGLSLDIKLFELRIRLIGYGKTGQAIEKIRTMTSIVILESHRRMTLRRRVWTSASITDAPPL